MKSIVVNNLPADVVEDVVGALSLAGKKEQAAALQQSVDRSRRGMTLVPAAFDPSFDLADLGAGAVGAFLMREYGADFLADKFPMFDSTLGTWILVTVGAAGAVLSWRVINHQVLGRLAGVGKYAALHEEDVREELKASTGDKRVKENRKRMAKSALGQALQQGPEELEAAEDPETELLGDLRSEITSIVSSAVAEAAAQFRPPKEKAAKPTTVSRKKKAAEG